MRSKKAVLIALVCAAVIVVAGRALAGDGESVSADLESSRLRILEPVGIFGSKPPRVQEAEVGDLVQLQLSYPISPPFPRHVDAKVTNRALTALWIAGTDGKVVALTPGKPQQGLVGVGHFTVFLRANTPGRTSAEVTVTLTDDTVRKIPIKFLIHERKKPDRAQRVKKILNVEYAIEKRLPPNLLVSATGEVPTLGWTQPILVRRTYVQPPPDGIWEYDLYAVPPSGPAAQVISQVKATDRWNDYDESSVKGVRVYGEDNGVMEKRFGKDPSISERTKGTPEVPRAFARLYVYRIPLKATDKLIDGPGGKAIAPEENAILVWADLMPSARFAHPTQYALIAGRKAKVTPGQWWPILNGKKILYGTDADYTVHLPFPLPISQPTATAQIMAYPLALGKNDKLTDGVEGKPIKIGEPMAFLWVDLKPGAKFVHPTLYVLVSRDQARVVEGEWFPVLNGSRILYGQQ